MRPVWSLYRWVAQCGRMSAHLAKWRVATVVTPGGYYVLLTVPAGWVYRVMGASLICEDVGSSSAALVTDGGPGSLSTDWLSGAFTAGYQFLISRQEVELSAGCRVALSKGAGVAVGCWVSGVRYPA